jgi:hypothetical protein
MYDGWDIGLPCGKAADDAGFALMRVHDVWLPIAHEADELPECKNVTGRRNRVDELFQRHDPEGSGNGGSQARVEFLAMNQQHFMAMPCLRETTGQCVFFGTCPKQSGKHMNDLHCQYLREMKSGGRALRQAFGLGSAFGLPTRGRDRPSLGELGKGWWFALVVVDEVPAV